MADARSGEPTWRPDRPAPERPLRGGISNRGLVVRVGDTVRRPRSTASPAIHALLRHLESTGFDGAPRYLGADDRGRDVLSYVEGDAVDEPHQPWALTDQALVSVARLLRRYHDAVEAFDPSPYGWGTTVPTRFGGTLACHNDPNVDNVVFRDGQAVALIDFDLASPGSALWDVALAARLWTPLRADEDVPDQRRGRAAPRLRTFVDAYGLAGPERERVVEAAVETHAWSYAIIRAGVARGVPGYSAYWTDDAQRRADRAQRWLVRNAPRLQDRVAMDRPAAGGVLGQRSEQALDGSPDD